MFTASTEWGGFGSGELEGSDHRLSPTVPSEPPEQARSLFLRHHVRPV